MSDTSHHVLTGKLDITSNLLVGSSHLFVDTNNNRVGLVTTDPHAGLHVNSNAYVNTDLRVGSGVVINDSANPGRITATEFVGDGSGLNNVPSGPAGAAATIDAGTTTTGVAGSSASVTNSGTTSAAVFDFTIPRGDQGIQGIQGVQGNQGIQGPSGTITIGTVTTVTNSSGASVTNSGTSENAVFNFNIPEGPTGQAGTNGADGADGADGTNYFTLSGSNIYRSTGNVGIGTTSVACRLDIAGEDVMIRGNTPSLNFSEGVNGMDGAFRIHYDGINQNDNDNFLAIQHEVNGSFTGTSLHCTLGGLVGIGASSPEETLHVNGKLTVRGGSTGPRFDVRTDVASHIIAGNWYSSAHSLCMVSAGSININMDYNANDTNKVIDFRTNTQTNGGTLLMRLKENGSVLIGDQHAVANYSSAQLILGGTHNSGFNNSNQIKLLITGGNNDGGAPKYIQCEDENGYDIFLVKGATSHGGGNALLYIKGEVKMQSAGDSYAFIPGNDGWLRLEGAASGQGNLYVDGSHAYTSLAVGNFYAAGSTRFSSDDRVKHFEEEIPNALELIQQLKPYKYKKTSEIYDEDYTGDIGEDWKWEIGLIAQDVEKIPYLEHVVSKPEDNPGNTYGLNYIEFIGVCIQGIKDLRKELQSEKDKVATMELLVASLVKRVGDLENLVI